MGDVVHLPKPDLSPDSILTAAKGKLASAIVLGFDADGAEWIRSSTSDVGVILYLLERAKAAAMASVTLTDAITLTDTAD
jgi:hypothetical protein